MQASDSPSSRHPSGKLRVLETTDLHMQLLDYDYFADKPDPTIGLIGLADQIAAMRDEDSVTTLLCDNGDLIQGNPLADHIAAHLDEDQVHPMIAALNLLQYDAMTLGNHELDYGLPFLQAALSKAQFPIVSANISAPKEGALAQPFVILERDISCDDGVTRPIKIGITGFAPPQINDWKAPDQSTEVHVKDIVETARKIVPQLQAAGADLILALCHSGIGSSTYSARMENAALPLATVTGIDALLLGHTHDAFPNPDIPNTAQADYATGRLHGKPAVMANYSGKSLGVIELDLHWTTEGWVVAGHKVHLKPAQAANGEESPLRKQLRGLVAEPHKATLDAMSTPIAQTNVPVVSYFATVQPDLSQQLLARAMQQGLSLALKDTTYGALPMLAAKSSFRFGGRSGLGHYIDIPAGPVTLRDAAAIFPFADRLCAVRRTGRQLRLWLERSAAHYNQMRPGDPSQPLINPQSAGYNCDTIFGLSYQIDLTQPARYDTHGQEIDARASRIRQMSYAGAPVTDTHTFIVATNSFRAKGGGGFPAIAPEDIVFTTQGLVRDYLITYLQQAETVHDTVHPTWSFTPIPKTAATFLSAPKAQRHVQDPVAYQGPGPDGFATYQIRF